MYAQLKFDATLAAPWKVTYNAMSGVALEQTAAEEKARRAGASMVVKMACPALPANEQAPIAEAVWNSIRYILPQTKPGSFEMHMALAHIRLDPPQKLAREQRIHDALYTPFAGLQTEGVQNVVKALKSTAVLVPDAALDVVLRSVMYLTVKSLLQSPVAVAYAPNVAFLNLVCAPLPTQAPKDAIFMSFFSRAPTEQQALVALFRQVPPVVLVPLLTQLTAALHARDAQIQAADVGDAVKGALQTWVDLGAQHPEDSALADVVAIELERFVVRRSARTVQIATDTMAAMNRGVVFDSGTTKSNREAVIAFLQAQGQLEQVMTVNRIQQSMKQPVAPVVRQPDTAPPDMDPVHSWSIDRLVQWIGGPVTRPDTPIKALNIQHITQQEQQARQGAPDPAKKSKTDPGSVFSEQDVQAVIRRGLCSSAEFFAGEIGDLLRLGARLHIGPQTLAPYPAHLTTLQHLIDSGAHDPVAAQNLLQAMEVAVHTLRQTTQQVLQQQQALQSQLRNRQRFTTCLDQLLQAEPLVRGKRHGGVVACALPLSDWGWAVQQFHRRWLPGLTQLDMDGVKVTLPPDQALGLYVTGSSLSAFAFDISVHLWRRSPQRTGAAGRQLAHLAPMNDDDWYDTYLPCAVLHVREQH